MSIYSDKRAWEILEEIQSYGIKPSVSYKILKLFEREVFEAKKETYFSCKWGDWHIPNFS